MKKIFLLFFLFSFAVINSFFGQITANGNSSSTTTVYTTEEITLQDGTVVTLKPLNLKGVRVFQKQLKEYNEYLMELADTQGQPDEDKTLDMFKEMTKTCLKREAPELVENDESFEEALDIDTIFRVLEVCAGIKLNDPNLQAAALMSLQTQ